MSGVGTALAPRIPWTGSGLTLTREGQSSTTKLPLRGKNSLSLGAGGKEKEYYGSGLGGQK